MKYRYISDSHTHSENSFDANDRVLMMCENASNKGLYSLTITDHCECQEYFEKDYRESISKSVLDISKARAVYHDRLHIFTGIELGQPTQDIKAAEDALSLAEYDFVLGSLHNLRGEEDFYFLTYTEENAPVLLERYFNELFELAQQNLFDSLAHITYPLRYIIGNAGLKINLDAFSEIIDEILITIIHNHKALEVNTSGLRQVIGKTLPDEDIINRYRELGGKYITLGSDAHRWGDIGSGIEEGLNLLLQCGFTHFTVFEKHEPKMLPIQ
ncbi:MAG: histidinol-phosphatase HisJ family protein [Acutalibacteraceae bacterium]